MIKPREKVMRSNAAKQLVETKLVAKWNRLSSARNGGIVQDLGQNVKGFGKKKIQAGRNGGESSCSLQTREGAR